MNSEDAKSADATLRPEDFRIITDDGQPAVELPTGQKIRLRAHVKVESEESRWGDAVNTKTEVDADDFAWWTIFPEEGGYPEVVIEPELIGPEGDDE